jgi:phenylalanyl-tRNA synthetase alpha chain
MLYSSFNIPYTSFMQDLLNQISTTANLEELNALEHELFGRKEGKLTLAFKELKDLPVEQKKQRATELNILKKQAEELIEQKKKELAAPSDDTLTSTQRLDVTIPYPKPRTGHLHLIPEFITQIEEVFGRLGFEVATGPEIDSEDFCFNFLNIPETHAARDAQDTFTIQNTNEKMVLRPHTSNVQVRYMQQNTPPFAVVAPGKVYRKESDATHSPMFHQFEAVMVGKDISLANLKAILITVLQELIGREVEFRFRPGYFPFVEPGLELDMMWQGNLEDSREGKWLEMGGCGMMHPNVLKHGGVDTTKFQGFALGFGIERLIMIKHQIPDLRSFYEGDLRFLEQF